jgi:hypothetical protein
MKLCLFNPFGLSKKKGRLSLFLWNNFTVARWHLNEETENPMDQMSNLETFVMVNP